MSDRDDDREETIVHIEPDDDLEVELELECDDEHDWPNLRRPREISIEFEAALPPRDLDRLLGSDERIELSGHPLGIDGEYRRCPYCDHDALVATDYYEQHLESDHNLER